MLQLRPDSRPSEAVAQAEGRRASMPVYRPRLPPAAALLPYLQRLDATRTYSNRGDLVCELEERLVDTLGLGSCRLVTAASGTAALQAAILASAGRATPARPVALVPGFTFVATALAAEACGYAVEFVDVEPQSWAMAAGDLLRGRPLERVGIVLPVAPFGSACPQSAWQAFHHATGIPVVIDAAASFEAIRRNPTNLVGRIPVAVSFHATKAFSTGEGGAVIWSDVAGLTRAVQAMNFGFLRSRQTRSAGFNGKMSEFHAAVGLASLDELLARDARRRRTIARYRAAASDAGFAERLVTAPAVGSTYVLFEASGAQAAADVIAALDAADIEHRRWYGLGAHREPYFRDRQRGALPIAESVAERLVGLPVHEDMAAEDIDAIAGALAGIGQPA